MNRLAWFLFPLVLLRAVSAFGTDCSQYLGRGYCTDYIQYATGQKQSGDAKDWTGDHDLTRLRDGDVAIFNSGTYGHVALVDKVNRDANGIPVSVKLGEWNFGATMVNKDCGVTNEFGVLRNNRVVPVASVARFWHIGKVESPPVTMCARKDATYRVCWLTKNGEDRSCEHATAWGIEDHIRRVSESTSSNVCLAACYEGQAVSSALDFFVSPAFAAKTLSSCAFRETSSDYESSISSLGEGYPIPATDPKVVNKPDFIIARSRLFAVDRTTEQYHFKKTDTMCMEGKLKNIGSGKIGDSDKVRTRFMVSNGYKEDGHGDWHGIASFDTAGSHVESGESHTEIVCVSLADKPYIEPGKVYNIVTCGDRTEVNNNDGGKYQEEHESNNCTDEMVYRIDAEYDIDVDAVSMSDTAPKAGSVVQMSLHMKNLRNQPVEDVPISIFFAPNGIWNDRWLADSFLVPKENLPENGSFSQTRMLMVPGQGEYAVFVCANLEGIFPETYTGNNCQSDSISVTRVLQPYEPVNTRPYPKDDYPHMDTATRIILFSEDNDE